MALIRHFQRNVDSRYLPFWLVFVWSTKPDNRPIETTQRNMQHFRFVACSWLYKHQGAVSIRKTVLPGMAIPMLKIRRPNGRLIFNMEIAIRRSDGLYIETGPCSMSFMTGSSADDTIVAVPVENPVNTCNDCMHAQNIWNNDSKTKPTIFQTLLDILGYLGYPDISSKMCSSVRKGECHLWIYIKENMMQMYWHLDY